MALATKGTRHFRLAEFACPHCGEAKVHRELLELLERIRSFIGDKPIRIRSGYRCPIHNAEVGGAKHSQHMKGRAADISAWVVTPTGAEACGASGIGISGNWAVHVDVRYGPLARWWY